MINIHKWVWIFLISITLQFWNTSLIGQLDITKLENPAVYNQKNGLESKYILEIAEDKLGFMWIATEDGIVRYDGSHFRRFQNFNTDSITHRLLGIEE